MSLSLLLTLLSPLLYNFSHFLALSTTQTLTRGLMPSNELLRAPNSGFFSSSLSLASLRLLLPIEFGL